MSAEPKPLATLCPEPLEVGPAPSTRRLREQEMELRALLMEDAWIDDTCLGEPREYDEHGFWTCHEGNPWPVGQALDELRLVERRIYQMGEDK